MIVKRARGHRLYTQDGKRILDVSMDRGRAVIGHRPNGLSLAIKNVIERGLYSRFNNIYGYRLKKYLGTQFPDYKYVTFLEYEDRAKNYFKESILDPLFNIEDDCAVAYWRPFIDTPNSRNLVLLYPLPGLNTTTILLSKEKPGIDSDEISPVLLAGILRSMYDYDTVLESFDIKAYSRYDSIPNTELKAPYLVINKSKDEYLKLVSDAEERGILMNDKLPMAILSSYFSKGETEKLLDLFN